MPNPNTKKLYDNKLQPFIQSADNQEIKESLEFMNNEMLIEQDNLYTNNIGLEAETAGVKINKKQTEEANKILQSNPQFKDSLIIDEYGLQVRNPKTEKQFDTPEFKNTIKNLNPKFNDNTKKILKEGLELINDLKNMDGSSFIKDKIDQKATIYQYIREPQHKAREILDKEENPDINKLTNLSNEFKTRTQTFDKLISLTEKLDCDTYVANTSCSRECFFQTKYLENYVGTSKVSGLFYVASYIKASGSTIDEYLENPTSVMNKFHDKFKNFSKVNELANDLGELKFIDEMSKGLGSKTVSDKYKDINFQFVPSQRFLIANSTMQKENSAEYRLYADLYRNHISTNFANSYNKMFQNYYKDNALQTTKNILITTDKNKNYASLTANKNALDIKDSYTSESTKGFDYKEYLESGKVDTKALIDKLTSYKEQAKNIKQTKLIESAITEISKDIVLSKKYDNCKEFDKFRELSGLTAMNYIEQVRGKESYKNYIEKQYDEIHKDGFNKEKIAETLNLAKGIHDKFKSRTWLGQKLWGRKEGKLLDKISNDLQANGVSKETLDSYLKGTTTKETLLESKMQPISKDGQSRVQITVKEASDDFNIDKSQIINDTQINKEQTKEQITENEMSNVM